LIRTLAEHADADHRGCDCRHGRRVKSSAPYDKNSDREVAVSIVARACLVLAAMLMLVDPAARAQIAPPRTLEELKAETQARADRNAYPLTGLKSADVRAALAKITSLDRDQWSAAWSSVADGYEADAKAADAAGRGKEAQEGYRQAWRLYSFARWPTPN